MLKDFRVTAVSTDDDNNVFCMTRAHIYLIFSRVVVSSIKFLDIFMCREMILSSV